MKKYLLAGPSAFALALTAGAAKADSTPGKFDIKISGDAYFEAGLISQSHDTNQGAAPNHNTSGDFINRLRLQINPEAKADNGLTYGAKVRIRANASDGRVDGDKAYIYMSGAFGEVQGGVVYHMNLLLQKSPDQRQAEVDQLGGVFPEYMALFRTAEPTANAVAAMCPTFPAENPAVWSPSV